MKKLTAILLLLSFLPSFLAAQSEPYSPVSSIERINQIIEELKSISQERENCLKELEIISEERKIELLERQLELQERMSELRQREIELQELKQNLELWGDLIDDQAIYLRSLNGKIKFWRVISLILGTCFITTIITAAVK